MRTLVLIALITAFFFLATSSRDYMVATRANHAARIELALQR